MKFLNYRGTRIRPYHLNLYRHYLFGMWSPALLASGAYGYFVLYPLVSEIFEKKSIDYAALLLPVGGLFLLLLLPLFICLWGRRRSFLKGGFFYRAYQRQMLARMLKSNGLYDKKERKSNEKNTEKMIFPKVYYRNTKEILYLTVPTDGMKWHDRFEKIAKTFEEMYIADFINVQKEMGFTTYSLMIDVISKRINISDCVVTNGQVKLMDGVVWDYAEVPHMLITGGTGGGKTYLILTLIQALVKVGTVDICDPKEADLKDLQDLKLFKGHVFTGKKWITRCLKNAVAEMNRRYVYMKLLPTYTTGKNFAYYDIPPYFIIVDEWAAFFGTLNYKEQDEILGYVKELVLKARQAGVFLILATQRPDAENFGGGIRDNILFRVSVGKLQEQGYYMTFGSDQKNKAFINKSIKGRGYVDDGSAVPREFYAPFVPKGYNFLKEFEKIGTMKLLDTREVDPTKEEIEEAQEAFEVKKSE
ncbi:FtsK/SpoIIIE domain-containing protein [Enterococcus faecalis]|uniref:FtsK/SpoIIIE domain-containing protein n=1 Tax=Enterococcus faecalis TaxID=1351 RepID=UPI00046C4F73|nr:FtsK/SpoIIIE domain-containing protein [Enterococcus faecalis]EGO8211581.1 cell division protein FtsK [Enterococcus faecalis]EHV2680146.1 cell division protein FtsK [Enterococcus faecalis]MCD5170582.1 cell division protein FtsK [Enterococcus faecalis]MCD5261362.1 cell division protein FtsK [Enterococcus faecalis]MCU2210517.1 FtsK/SpoIIIE domain-containing protein [Enterococcus faecalis]